MALLEQDVIVKLIDTLSDAGLNAYDSEPPLDEESPFVYMIDDTNGIEVEEFFGDNNDNVVFNKVIRIVELKEKGMDVVRTLSQTVFDSLHKKTFTVDSGSFHVRNLYREKINEIDRWNLIEHTYYIIGD